VSLTEDALATAFRTGLPFVGLRDHAHDPDLDRLIPPDAARTARAIPLTADDDRIRLAVADPDADLSTLDKYLAGRQIDLALAPREEIDTILGPPPPHPLPAEYAAPTQTTPSDSAPEPIGDTEPQPEPLAAETDPFAAESEPDRVAEPEPVAAEQPAATDVAGIDVEPSAEPDPFVAESETDRVAEPEPVATEQPATTDVAGSEVKPSAEPDSLLAEPETEGAAEVDQAAGEEAASSDDAPSEPEPFAAEAAPEPVGAVAPGERGALSDADAELAGEVPSWLEPPRRRWWRVVLAVLLVLVVLAAAAVAVVALVNA
jgi:Type II secretion system (T2SS), protein E, N-terminal domain